jgi:uncharacterized protein involved in response to NO
MNALAPSRIGTDTAPRWRLAWLLAAPHRLAFAAGTLMLVVASLGWAAVLLAPDPGASLRWSLRPAAAHGLLMTFGFLPMFFAGFLFTAGPKWLARPPVAARELVTPLMAQLAGWAVFGLALHGRDAAFGRSLGSIGLAAVTFGWFGIVRRFGALVAGSRVPDRVHARLVCVGAAIGIVALAAASAGLMAGHDALVRAATHAGLWGFVGLVVVGVAHRMIPFFSAAPGSPFPVLGSLVALAAVEAGAEVAAALAGSPGPVWLGLRAGFELAAAAGLLGLAVRSSRLQRAGARMATMLHIGCTWLGVAVLLSGIAHAVAAAGGPAGVFGLAPLHAYTMGFLGSTLLAMVTRISSTHRGGTLAADDLAWRLFWILQLATVARLAAAFVSGASASWGTALVGTAALGWAGALAAWGLRHLHWYGTPRPDGRAG